MTDFQSLIQELRQGNVEFIIVGGFAAVAHGASRLTTDLDVVYSRTRENFRRLATALRPLGPRLRGAPEGIPFQWDEETLSSGLNFTLTTTLGDIDLLGEIAGGGSYESLLPHVITLRLFGLDCLCLDLETLIQVKRAAGRRKDLEAAAELELLLAGRDAARGDPS